ncbi:MAG TPA: inositol monophosphatase family protein [Pirellulales bacterium]|nr:inositol monophosphatase family protein [Pirellulales bacterium]
MDAILEYKTVCERAARAGGAVLLDWAGRFAVREKGPADLVTEADLASQEAIQKILLDAFPDHGFLAEENCSIPSQKDGLRWIVDPLDGTTNYVHGLPVYAVSIALEQSGKLLAGTVYNPVAEECYVAAQGHGAELNGKPLRVSQTASLDQALVAASLPAKVRRDDPDIKDFLEVTLRCRAVRRMGSSALNLCYLAAGRFDAYWARSTKAWDIAAGLLMVREAGGVVSSLSGGEPDLADPQFVSACTPALHQEISQLLGCTAC